MDKVFIRELKINTIIGVLPWERQVRQTVVLDLEMAWDNSVPATSGRLCDALDYSAVASRLEQFVESANYELLETLAEDVASLLQKEFKVPWLQLSINKPGAVLQAETVGVVIQRGEIS